MASKVKVRVSKVKLAEPRLEAQKSEESLPIVKLRVTNFSQAAD